MKNSILRLKSSNVKKCSINLPGSKSISNRILFIASLGHGSITINNLLLSDDTKVMIEALSILGINIHVNKSLRSCILIGSKNNFPNKNADIYIGNAGTAIRPLTAALAFNEGEYFLHGTTRMHERPIGDLVESLISIGAKINYEKNIGFPPLKINASKIKNNKIKINGSISSQFLTSLLLSSPIFSKTKNLEIEVEGHLISKPYIDITLKLMKLFGLKIQYKNYDKFTIPKNQNYSNPININVEGDASSATYFLAAAAISGKIIRVNGIGSKTIQGDIFFIEILKKMGAKINISEDWIEVISNSKLISIDADFNNIPDAAMTVAILALYAEGKSILRNIGSWRVKETDRLDAMTNELSKLGAIVNQGKDFLEITAPKILQDAIIDTYDDHRMAMCFSLVSLNSKYKKGANITMNNPNCVAKTFPNYFDIFNSILE